MSLRVNINGKWHYADTDFILIQMTDKDKENINNMHEDCDSYIVHPDHLDDDKVDEKIEELKSIGYCPACVVDNPVESLLKKAFMAKLISDEYLEKMVQYDVQQRETDKIWRDMAYRLGKERLFGFDEQEEKVLSLIYDVLYKIRHRGDAREACMLMESKFDFLEPKVLEEKTCS